MNKNNLKMTGNKVSVQDFSNLCRLCFSKASNLWSIFKPNLRNSRKNLPLCFKIMTCASVTIYEGDQLPQRICKPCVELVEQSYSLRMQIEKSDSKFKKLLDSVQKISNENVPLVNPFGSCESELIEVKMELSCSELSKPEIHSYSDLDTNDDTRLEQDAAEFSDDREQVQNKDMENRENNVLEPESADGSNERDDNQSSTSDDDRPLKVIDRKKKKCRPKKSTSVGESAEVKIKKKRGKRRPCPHKELVTAKMPDYGKVMDDGESYFCNPCKKLLKCYRNFYEHVKFIHLNIRDYLCTHCGYQAQNNFLLSQHIDSQHSRENKYACTKCPRMFCTRQNLRVHQYSSHAPENRERTHVCETCGKAFFKWNILKRHLATHGDRIAHKCKHCDRTFVLMHSLRRHERRHTGEKPYRCSFCPAAYWQSTDRKNHEARVHKNQGQKHGSPSDGLLVLQDRENGNCSVVEPMHNKTIVGVNFSSHNFIEPKLTEKAFVRMDKPPPGLSEFHCFME